VKLGNGISQSFKVKTGLRNGNALSPAFFNLAFEYSDQCQYAKA